MELIPILSTIILVATISTFMLAIGAYVLYKVRESKGQRIAAAKPSAIRAELVTPGEAPLVQFEQGKAYQQPVFVEQEPARIQRQPAFVQQYNPSAQNGSRWQTAQPRPNNAGNQRKRYYEGGTAPEEKAPEKFYKYTSEGYVNPKQDKQPGALKWR